MKMIKFVHTLAFTAVVAVAAPVMAADAADLNSGGGYDASQGLQRDRVQAREQKRERKQEQQRDRVQAREQKRERKQIHRQDRSGWQEGGGSGRGAGGGKGGGRR